jgi:hypothetical protein
MMDIPCKHGKNCSALNIELFELFEPADTPLPAVFGLFSKYNDEVLQAVSTACKQIYGYFQRYLREKRTEVEKQAGK